MTVPAKERVLVVDDEPQVLVALEDLLSAKFTVFSAGSAHHALKLMLEEHDIAVVISDQRMPRMTGDELLQLLAQRHDALHIMLTGFADLSAVIRAVNDGRIFAYVPKPWDPHDLEQRVEKAAEHFRLGRDLAHERTLLHDLMNNTPDGIYFKDRELRFRRANRSLAFMLGQKTPEDLVGKRLRDFTPHAEMLEADEECVMADATPRANIVREQRRADAVQWVSETKAPIKGPGGKVVGLVGIVRDITQQRQLESQLIQARKMEAIGRMAGGIAHDFNNLLVVIQSYGQILMEDLEEGDSRREDLGQMMLASERAAALTRQLLAFSKRQAVQTKTLRLNELIAALEGLLSRMLGENVGLETRLSPALGTMRADPSQMEQIVFNLALNARDAMPAGGKLTLETASVMLDEKYAAQHPGVDPGEYVLLRVSDTGIGMSAETLERIFEPFFTTKEVGKGTGLGLSTVYGIVQQNGGHIRVDSELGVGTSFEICFPSVDRLTAEASVTRSGSELPAGAETILLVEEDDAVRQIAARILRAHGHRVLLARNPEEARRICAQQRLAIHLLLADIVMPEVTGPDLARELVQLCPDLRVLYMSGYPGRAVSDLGTQVNLVYVEKPFTPDSLMHKVREALERS